MATAINSVLLVPVNSDTDQASQQDACMLSVASGDNAGCVIFDFCGSSTFEDTLST